MSDDRLELERLLRAKAAEIPSYHAAPGPMLARARWRVVRNAVSSVLAAGLLVAAVAFGLATLGPLGGSNGVRPGGTPGGHSPAPSRSCVAANLRATASLGGAAGSVEGSIDITNTGAGPCTLEGRPVLALFDSSGSRVAVRTVDVAPQWSADGRPAPPGWPVVRLRPGQAASVRVRWSNACPQLSGSVRLTIDLGRGRGTLGSTPSLAPPPCNGASEPSTLEVGPYEPIGLSQRGYPNTQG